MQTEMKKMNNMIPLTIANTLDQSTKKRVEVAANQTVKEAVLHHNPTALATFDVYDGEGKLVSNEQAAHHRDATLYVGVEKVIGGGVPRQRLGELQIEYPSIQPVKQWTDRKEAKMLLVRFPSNGRTRSGFWEVVIHCPNASSALMHAYVLNFNEITLPPSVSLFANPPSVGYAKGASNGFIPGSSTTQGHWVCHGRIEPHLQRLGKDPVVRVGAYINHIQNLLNG